jgi:hypothetical protein
LDFILDIHVSNTLLGFFVVGNAYDSVFRYTVIIENFHYKHQLRNECHIVFPKMLAQNCLDYSAENTMYNKDTDKAGTARSTVMQIIIR